MDDIYAFVYRGILTEASLDKNGRHKAKHFSTDEAIQLNKSLSLELLDQELLIDSQRMAVIYSAIHTFENMVRHFVMKAMAEQFGETWWSNVPERIQKKVSTRMEEDEKFRWHGRRGATEINYCDFGDLSSMIINNWEIFEAILSNIEWAKQILGTLEKSRNIVMHGGILENEDVERIGMNIRDWVRQVG